MSLQLRKSSKWWYAQFLIDGKRLTENLDIEITGTRPASINEEGDAAFEQSRAQAQVAHDRREKEITQDRHAINASQQLIAIKTGKEMKFPKLETLADDWMAFPRAQPISPRYADQCQRHLQIFTAWLHEHYPTLVEFVEVNDTIAYAYLQHQEKRGISGKQYNEILKLLSSTFKKLHPQIDQGRNPFYRIPKKKVETAHRRPFTPEELGKIHEQLKDDDFMRPFFVCGMCTAMRLGDCAQLKWADVDLDEGFLNVSTSKTGMTAEIPIFPLLHEELMKADRTTEYVFPEHARMHRHNSGGLSYRFSKVLIEAGFGGAPTRGVDAGGAPLPQKSKEVTRKLALRMIDAMPPPANRPDKPDLMRKVLDQYLQGATVPELSKELKIAQGTASNYLNELEDKAGIQIVRRRPTGVRSASGDMREERQHGVRQSTRLSFHSLRVTWVTLALTAGLPMELVKAVTGHQTVDIVLKHYFKPRREQMRASIEAVMPQLLPSPDQVLPTQPNVEDLLASATEETAWEVLEEVKKLMARSEPHGHLND